jgi:hypothetical protein
MLVPMDLVDRLSKLDQKLPAPLRRCGDGSLGMTCVIAERKTFLARRKLTYKCRLRVDDAHTVVRFWEALVETGSGLAGDGMAPGVGLKKESYRTGGKTRKGAIEEQSRLLGKRYDYRWDYSAVRRAVAAVAGEAGYTVEVVLSPKAV